VSELFLSNGQRSTLIDKLFVVDAPQGRQAVLTQYRRDRGYQSAVKKIRGLTVAGPEQGARDDAIAAAAAAQAVGDRSWHW